LIITVLAALRVELQVSLLMASAFAIDIGNASPFTQV